jgi:acetyl esterase/lipase
MSSELPRWSNRFPLSRRARRRIGVATAIVAGGLVVSIVTSATPWPSALLIRRVFEAGARSTVEEMLPYVPDTKLVEHPDVVYGDAGGNTSLDVFSPAGAEKPLPTVVWIHGGAWISGNKFDVAPYLKILAAKGYTTVGLNYTIAPEAVYPTAVDQLNDALKYLTDHAGEFNIDPQQIVLAGDSAGAQLASQLAVLTTNPDYATLLGIQPALSKNQLVGTILNCGVYDLRSMADLTGIPAWGFKIALWGYTGTKNWSETYAGTTMSTVDFVTEDFPPTFISGGNGDGLTWIQSVPMSTALKDKNVDVTELFWAAGHQPALPHEYQFHLDFEDAQTALDRTIAFLDEHTKH